jgi:hypothetical protein
LTIRITLPKKHPGSIDLKPFYPQPPRDRASDLLAIAAENYRNGYIAAAEAAWNERERLINGQSVWQPDPPQVFKPFPIKRPWEIGQ